jgi:hypothetical protein
LYRVRYEQTRQKRRQKSPLEVVEPRPRRQNQRQERKSIRNGTSVVALIETAELADKDIAPPIADRKTEPKADNISPHRAPHNPPKATLPAETARAQKF